MDRSDATAVLIFTLVLLVSYAVDVPFFAAFVAVVVLSTILVPSLERVVGLLTSDDQDEDDLPVGVRTAHEAYVAGEIDERELDDQVGRALDPDVRAIMTRFEHADDVGPKTCERLADVFGTVESIERATPDELEQVDGVGPERAKSIATVERPEYTAEN